ncbi:ATP-dependent DNA helicase Q-like 3 [Dendrobium catenatum]|uniref:ATP-dependent DNA helicase Q-like 3 n=1 Tax=Dendrobium catenatum TaxID=906689 RepID=A0A2I0WPR8_9ASPA|nr:ATP-dependent DNA helicase Q-like 3 [Dendrobium catenatum]
MQRTSRRPSELLQQAFPRTSLVASEAVQGSWRLTLVIIGTDHLNPTEMVDHLRKGMGIFGQIIHIEEINEKLAVHVDVPNNLANVSKAALRRIGITRLYSHQAEAIKSSLSGNNVVVATSTSSGKSLCYNIPVIEALSKDMEACAIYIFPTKALAQDQMRALMEMTSGLDIYLNVGIYDGDTSQMHRTWIRDNARVLITNPDMLHLSILPYHAKFQRILSNLRIIVIDEAHTYKGAFGCHTALILRRLRRICLHVHDSNPLFIFCTATSANPREHAMEVKTSKSTGKFWHSESALRRTRREILQETASSLVNSVRVYRGGYTPQDRRKIETDLFEGKLQGVAATNALELGIDVGYIDATLHLGFPGSVASLWQQAGRSGRRSRPSLAIYIAFEGPLDQYFMKFPDKLFRRSVEYCQVDSHNEKVLEQHIACAAFEIPVSSEYDEKYFGPSLERAILSLKNKGHLVPDPEVSASKIWNYVGPEDKPSAAVSIRAIDDNRYKVIDKSSNEVLEEIEESKAFFQAYLPPMTTEFASRRTSAQVNACTVTTNWFGFYRIWRTSNQIFDKVELSLPSYSYNSQAAWIRVPQSIKVAVQKNSLVFRAGLHAASHALLNVVPLYMMCNTSDLGTECANPHETRDIPERLLLYDQHSGGIGLSLQIQRLFRELLIAALELVSTCSCLHSAGCPNCVQVLTCSEYNEVLDKKAAMIILDGVIEAENSQFSSRESSGNPSID